MKRITFLMVVLCTTFIGSLPISAQNEIELTASRIKKGELGNDYPRGSIYVPSASIDDHTFYVNESHPDYVLQLVDSVDEKNVIYEVWMPAGVNSVVLPSLLVGEYVIQLLWTDWRFGGYIELE